MLSPGSYMSVTGGGYAGLVMTYRLDFDNFAGFDVGVCLLLYVISTFVRLSIVTLVWCFEAFVMKQKVFWQDAIVTTWGGLRGAVGLALALMVFNETYLQQNGSNPDHWPPTFRCSACCCVL